MEEMIDEGQVYRLEGEGAFCVEKWATWRGLVLGMHGVRTGKWVQGRRLGWCGEG